MYCKEKRFMVRSVMLGTVLMATLFTGCASGGSGDAGGSGNSDTETGKDTSEESKEGESNGGGETYTYNVGASATSGQSYRWAVPVCELVNKYSDFVTLNPITTTGSTENVNLIVSGEAPLGVGPASTVYNAINGTADWEGNPVTGIEFVYAYMPDYFYVALPENSSVETLADLKGMTVSIGETGSGNYTNAAAALEAMGYSLDDFKLENLSYTDSASAIAEGWLDGYILYGSATTSAFSEMQAGPTGLKVVAVTEDEIETACVNNPVFIPRVMEKSYPGIDPINTYGGTTALFAREDVPDEVTYEIAKIINEHVDELAEAFDLAEFSAIENSVDSVSIVPTAGGTEQYMKELGLIQ